MQWQYVAVTAHASIASIFCRLQINKLCGSHFWSRLKSENSSLHMRKLQSENESLFHIRSLLNTRSVWRPWTKQQKILSLRHRNLCFFLTNRHQERKVGTPNCLCFQLFHVTAVNEVRSSDKVTKLKQEFGNNWGNHLSIIAQHWSVYLINILILWTRAHKCAEILFKHCFCSKITA